MEKQYIRILKESLCRKKEILEELKRLSEKQAEVLREEWVDWGLFDQYTDQKADGIEELEKLDEGFELVFDRVKEGLVQHKEVYREEIAFLQKLITMITDLSMSLQAIEHRNKQQIEQRLLSNKQEIGKRRVTARAASTYYQQAKQLQGNESLLLDDRK